MQKIFNFKFQIRQKTLNSICQVWSIEQNSPNFAKFGTTCRSVFPNLAIEFFFTVNLLYNFFRVLENNMLFFLYLFYECKKIRIL